MLLKRSLLFCGLGLLALLPFASTCSCSRPHEQQNFCEGRHAMEFYVTKVTKGRFNGDRFVPQSINSPFFIDYYSPDLYNQFRITALKIYQPSERLKHSTFSYIYSLAQGSLCGKILSPGHRYAVIGAEPSGGDVFIDYCMDVIDLGDYPAYHVAIVRSNLAGVYSRGCECDISYCGMEFPFMGPCLTNSTMKCERSELSSSRRPFGEACIPYHSSNGTKNCTWF